jgi:hypothetical protein
MGGIWCWPLTWSSLLHGCCRLSRCCHHLDLLGSKPRHPKHVLIHCEHLHKSGDMGGIWCWPLTCSSLLHGCCRLSRCCHHLDLLGSEPCHPKHVLIHHWHLHHSGDMGGIWCWPLTWSPLLHRCWQSCCRLSGCCHHLDLLGTVPCHSTHGLMHYWHLHCSGDMGGIWCWPLTWSPLLHGCWQSCCRLSGCRHHLDLLGSEPHHPNQVLIHY